MDCKEEEILVIVKVYPAPSIRYGEVVCTAGITKAGKLIRLYPVPYRDLPREQQFKKFQWIKAKVQPASEKLQRPESHKIDASSIELLRHIPPGPGWKERMKYVTPLVSSSVEDIIERQKQDGTSMAIFKPKEVIDFVITPEKGEWNEKKKGVVGQNSIFNAERTALEKIPYSFHYKFSCDDSRCTGHDMIILDWEAVESYRNFKTIYGDEKKTLEKVKEKWFDFFFK